MKSPPISSVAPPDDAARDDDAGEPTDAAAPRAELPELTPRQYLVIWLLLDGRKSGRELRRQLASCGARMSKPAFSQLMCRLQFARLVRSDRVCDDPAGAPVHHCVYQARPKALRRWRAARAFYARLQEPPGAEAHLFDESIQRREDQQFQDEFVRLGMACALAETNAPPP